MVLICLIYLSLKQARAQMTFRIHKYTFWREYIRFNKKYPQHSYILLHLDAIPWHKATLDTRIREG